MAYLHRYVCILLATVWLASCSNEDDGIRWQLPLPAPVDQHEKAVAGYSVPEWAKAFDGALTLRLLHTSTARTWDLQMPSVGAHASEGEWSVRLLGLASGLRLKGNTFIQDNNVHNPAAFVELSFSDKVVYRGWMYQEFPELFGPDIQDWKVWVKTVSIRDQETQ